MTGNGRRGVLNDEKRKRRRRRRRRRRIMIYIVCNRRGRTAKSNVI